MDFCQGSLPSCQTLAAIGAIALNPRGRQMLTDMVIQDSKDDSYLVTFPELPDRPIRVKPAEIAEEDQTAFAERRMNSQARVLAAFNGAGVSTLIPYYRRRTVEGDTLVRVLECAYARYMKTRYENTYADVNDNSIHDVYRHRFFHYRASDSLADFTGWTVQNLIASGGPDPDESDSFREESKKRPEVLDMIKNQLMLVAHYRDDWVATVCSVGSKASTNSLDPGNKIVPWHDHILAAVDPNIETVTVIDPYNSRISMILQYWDFLKYFNLISIARVV